MNPSRPIGADAREGAASAADGRPVPPGALPAFRAYPVSPAQEQHAQSPAGKATAQSAPSAPSEPGAPIVPEPRADRTVDAPGDNFTKRDVVLVGLAALEALLWVAVLDPWAAFEENVLVPGVGMTLMVVVGFSLAYGVRGKRMRVTSTTIALNVATALLALTFVLFADTDLRMLNLVALWVVGTYSAFVSSGLWQGACISSCAFAASFGFFFSSLFSNLTLPIRALGSRKSRRAARDARGGSQGQGGSQAQEGLQAQEGSWQQGSPRGQGDSHLRADARMQGGLQVQGGSQAQEGSWQQGNAQAKGDFQAQGDSQAQLHTPGAPHAPQIPQAQTQNRDTGSRGILLGVLIAIVLLALVIPLLASADSVFGSIYYRALRAIGTWLANLSIYKIVSYIVNFMVFTPFLFALLFAFDHAESQALEEQTPAAQGPSSIQPLTVVIVLAAIDIVYLLFVGVQFMYLFGGAQDAAMTFGYANYARTGFFQLTAVTAINVCVGILAARWVSRNDAKVAAVRVLTVALVALTCVILASAAWRMGLYIYRFGLSKARLATLFIMVFCAVLLVVVVARSFKASFRVFRVAFTWALALWLVFNYINPNALVANYNVSMYLSGRLAEVDVDYLGTLGPESEGPLAKLEKSQSEEQAARAAEALESMRDNYSFDSWQYWALPLRAKPLFLKTE